MRFRSLLAAGVFLGARGLSAQDVQLSVGGVQARYADSLSGTAGSLGLRLVHEGASVRGGLDITHSRFTSGGGASTQAAGTLALLRALSPRFGVGLKLDASTSFLSGDITAHSGDVEAFAAVLRPRWLVSASIGGGGLQNIQGITHPVVSGTVRARRDLGPVIAEASAASTWSGAVRFTDFTAGGEWRRGVLRLGAIAGARQGDLGGGALLQLRAELRVLPAAAIEAAAGSYPRDLSGFTSGRFVNLGMRIDLAGGMPSPARAAAAPRRDVQVEVAAARQARVTVVVPNAQQVAIAGEWNEWRSEPMTRLDGNRWQALLPLGAGAYRFTLVLDGTRWVVPNGVPKMPDDFGGEVGVLVIS